jgi:hypothetical protein
LPWEAIKYVSTGFTLCAFVVAALLSYFKSQTQEQRKRIESARPEDRADLVVRTLEFFNIDTTGLSRDQQFLIAMRQINGRIERFRIVAIVVVVLAIIGAGLSAYALTVQKKITGTVEPTGETVRTNPADTKELPQQPSSELAGQKPSRSEQAVATAPQPSEDASASTASQLPAQSNKSATKGSADSSSGERSTARFHSDKTPVLVRCDADCTLRIDGKSAGSLKANDSTTQELSFGDHIIEAMDRAGTTTWTKTLTVQGTSQIIVITELQKLLFSKNAAWVVGTWERRTSQEVDTFSAGRDSTCWKSISRISRIIAFVNSGGTTLSLGIHFSQTSTFPNTKFQEVCQSEKNDEDAEFSFVVTELSAQSAKATLTAAQTNEGTFDWASYCRSSCNAVTLSRRTEGELILSGIPFTFFDGEYQRAD